MANYTLFVFGNGFDLAHGLPTSYNDFFYFLESLRIYAQHPGRKLNSNIHIKENLKPEVFDYLLKVLSGASHPQYIDTIMDTLHFHDENTLNPWHTYFSRQLKEHLPDVTWIDFEKEIKNLVASISTKKANDRYLESVKGEMSCKYSCFPEKIQTLGNRLHNIAPESPKAQDLWDQLERELALFLYEELLRYAFCFELYLCFYVAEEYLNMHYNSIPLFENQFAKAFHPSNRLTDPSTFILSFNYTCTCESLYNIGMNDIHHIHGKVREKVILEKHMSVPAFQLETPIVLGFHNPSTDANFNASPYLWFEKFYQRMLHKTGLAVHKWLKSVIRDTRHSATAIFYGHSLDVTDKDLIIQVFEMASLVQIYYHEESRLPELISNLIKIFGKKQVEADYNSGKIIFISTAEV